jgi:large subunit ribosomal protein L16
MPAHHRLYFYEFSPCRGFLVLSGKQRAVGGDMFNPIKLKFKKEHKSTFKNKELSLKKSSLLVGDFGISAAAKGVLFYKEIEAARKTIAKKIKGLGLVFTRVRPNRPRTEKKKGMRMGKGKGAVGSWVVQVPAGLVLFEVSGFLETKKIKEVFKSSSLRLSIATKHVFF